MPVIEFTDRFCQSAKSARASQIEFFDTIVRGLSLVVSAGGTKTFYLHFTKPADGKRGRFKLGRYPEIKLVDARRKARDGRGGIGEGKDPIVEKRALAASQTVADLVENYVARHASTKRSGDEIARRLRKNVTELIGDVKLAELHRRDITRCIDAVKDRGAHVEANRLFEDVRAMVRWARGRGDLDTNLVEGMRKPSATVERDRVLTADEIKIMWATLANADMRESTRRVLRLCLVTGQRVGEVAGLTRGEIDLAKRIWLLSAGRSKNSRDHQIPLSSMALKIIGEQIAASAELAGRKGRAVTEFIFPAPGGRAAVAAASIAKAVKRQERLGEGGIPKVMGIASWTPHDLRRTAATGMEEVGVSPFVIAQILNHVSLTKATITSRIYARYDYSKEKREALELWEDRLAGILDGRTSVVSLARAAVR